MWDNFWGWPKGDDGGDGAGDGDGDDLWGTMTDTGMIAGFKLVL